MADVYPYTASSTGLTSRLPGFAMDGGKDAMVERLAHPPMRAAIAEAVASRFGADIDPAGVIVAALGPSTTGDDYSWTIGLGLTEIGERDGCAPEEAAMRLLHAHDGSVAIVNHAMDPQDVEAVLAHPLVSIASDGWTLAATGAGRPHPRSFGTFARVLGHYVRDRGVMPLEGAIRKMTSQPADRLRLNDRGMLAIGKVADVVIFDAATVRDNATYSDPWQLSSGVSTVLLAGEAAVSDGAVTDRRCGRVLRRSA
jgi:N-acyl-D-amino-acid deacylase